MSNEEESKQYEIDQGYDNNDNDHTKKPAEHVLQKELKLQRFLQIFEYSGLKCFVNHVSTRGKTLKQR